MPEKIKITDIVMLRMHIQSNPGLRVELLAGISKVMRDHDLEIGENMIYDITLAVGEEIQSPLRGPNLPGGTNC
jgi:hypothetical protein